MTSNGWPVVGHEWAVELLQSSLASQRLPHALLFAGPAQIGKRTLALGLAAALNCQGQPKPCGQCRSCRNIVRGSHADVRTVQVEAGDTSREGVLKIDQIRELQHEAALAPMESPHKIFILREIERANLPAANALLKTLEEPPSQVVLLLTSARPQSLLPTIVSRCQVLMLRPLPLEQVASALVQRWGAQPERADLLARLSAGRLGWAVQRLTDTQAWDERARRLADTRSLVDKGRLDRLAYADVLGRTPTTVQPTLALWTSWWRDILLVQQGCPGYVSNIDLAGELAQEAPRFNSAQVRSFLARLQAAPAQLNQNANTRLLLETLVLHLPTPTARD